MTTYLRADWGAPTPPGGAVLTGPLDVIAIHHTAARTPATEADVLAEVRQIYVEHTSPSSWDSSKPWADIGYSWLVDAWGNIYQGRGWLRSGAHTPGYNSKAHGIAYIGWGLGPIPMKAIAAIAQCVVNGQRAGAVTLTPTFIGHRDALATVCPGDGLYGQLPLIRSAVLDMPPATIDPGDDVLTPEQEAKLDRVLEVSEQIAGGHLTGAVVRELDPRLNAISAQVDAIRGTAVDLAVIPTSVLVAELGRRASA